MSDLWPRNNNWDEERSILVIGVEPTLQRPSPSYTSAVCQTAARLKYSNNVVNRCTNHDWTGNDVASAKWPWVQRHIMELQGLVLGSCPVARFDGSNSTLMLSDRRIALEDFDDVWSRCESTKQHPLEIWILCFVSLIERPPSSLKSR